MVKIKTANIKPIKIGFRSSLEMMVTVNAPKNENKKAETIAGRMMVRMKGICLENRHAEKDVPVTETSLLVPNKVTNGNWGRTIMRAGS